MITLNVEPYCNECKEFEPVVERFYADCKVLQQTVICAHRGQCASIACYIQKQMGGEKDGNG